MRRAALFVLLVSAVALAAIPALAVQQEEEPNRATVVWEMGGWEGRPVWDPPQEFVAVQFTVDGDINSADHLIPECGYFQVDVYKYNNDSNRAKVDNLIAGGLLYGPNNPPEPLISGGQGTAWKFVNQGECPPPTTTTTTTEPPTTTTTEPPTTTTTEPPTTTTTEPPTTTTTEPPTTTTTVPETTTTMVVTTTVPETTTTEDPTTTTVATTTTEQPCDEDHPAWNEETQSCELPFTGFNDTLLGFTIAGLGLALLGLTALAIARTRSDQ